MAELEDEQVQLKQMCWSTLENESCAKKKTITFIDIWAHTYRDALTLRDMHAPMERC